MRNIAALIFFSVATLYLAFGPAPMRPAAAEESPNLTCPGCPPPSIHPIKTPTPAPKHTPIIKDPQGDPDGQGYDYHSQYTWFTNYLDAYAQVWTSGLYVDCSDPNAFVTDEMWRTDGTNAGWWQEIGYVVGSLQTGGPYSEPVCTQGLFGAYNEPTASGTEYVEFLITSQPAVTDLLGSPVSLATEIGNATSVDFNYDGSTYATAPAQSSSSSNVTVGVESNSSNPEFNLPTSTIYIVYPQILGLHPTSTTPWTFWPADSGNLTFYDDAPGGDPNCLWIESQDLPGALNSPEPGFEC